MEQNSQWRLSCRLPVFRRGHPKNSCLIRQSARRRPQSRHEQGVRTWLTGELPARLCRPAGSQEASCFSQSQSLSECLIGAAMKGDKKKTVNGACVCLFTAIFTTIVYTHHTRNVQVDLNVDHTCFKFDFHRWGSFQPSARDHPQMFSVCSNRLRSTTTSPSFIRRNENDGGKSTLIIRTSTDTEVFGFFFCMFPAQLPRLLSKWFKAVGRQQQITRLRLWACVWKC